MSRTIRAKVEREDRKFILEEKDRNVSFKSYKEMKKYVSKKRKHIFGKEMNLSFEER